MPRPSQLDEQRQRLLPIVCKAFSEFGYRRTTTAELARRCQVRENILYRLWPDKKAMYLAAVDSIYAERLTLWDQLATEPRDDADISELLLSYEAEHQGESGLHKILFDALGEADDPEVREMVISVYRRFHAALQRHIEESRPQSNMSLRLPIGMTVWGLIGLATVSNIIRELDLLPVEEREEMFLRVGKALLSADVGSSV
jgi:AcrR family transcriptional regulator